METVSNHERRTEAIRLADGTEITFDGYAHELMDTAADQFVDEVLVFMRE